jgi:hypothetical protein
MSDLILRPNITVEVRDAKTQKIIGYSYGRNLIVNAGRNEVRDLLGGTGFEPDEMAVGSGDTAVTATDTALASETFRKSIDRRIGESYKITFQILLTGGDADGTTIKEAGLFTQSTLYARALISPTITKDVGIDVTISHEITITSS